jgi:hypothetical protein
VQPVGGRTRAEGRRPRRRRLAGAALAFSLLAGLSLGVSAPAGATTANESFVIRVYQDFLFRDPTAGELTWWATAIGGGTSRATMVASVLDTAEFELYWIAGVNTRYLGSFDSTSTEVDDQISDIASTGDFLDTELAVLEGAQYFADAGSTNTGYVTALYDHVLDRAPDPSGLTYWSGRLTAGTSTRRSVASSFIQGNEAAGLRVNGPNSATSCAFTELTEENAVLAGTYCIVLDRLASGTDESFWVGQLTTTDQLPDLWASIAGSTEYFNGAQP